jgi:hypothetical protein
MIAADDCGFDRASHTYTIGGRVAVSVTQVLTDVRLVDFSSIPDAIRRAALERGAWVHQALHAYLEDDYDVDDAPPEYRGYLDSAIAYLGQIQKTPVRDASGKAIAVEYRFWHRRRMFAGTVDYVGFDADGVLSIDDWKSGSPDDVAAAIQTAAYECGVRESLLPTLDGYDGPIRRRAVKLFRDGRPGAPDPYTDPRDLSIFFNALSVVHFRRNNLRHDR